MSLPKNDEPGQLGQIFSHTNTHTLTFPFSCPSSGWIWAGVCGRSVTTRSHPSARCWQYSKSLQQQGQRPHGVCGQSPEKPLRGDTLWFGFGWKRDSLWDNEIREKATDGPRSGMCCNFAISLGMEMDSRHGNWRRAEKLKEATEEWRRTPAGLISPGLNYMSGMINRKTKQWQMPRIRFSYWTLVAVLCPKERNLITTHEPTLVNIFLHFKYEHAYCLKLHSRNSLH